MPSPSKLSLVISLVATGGFLYGGAWLASGMTPANVVPQSEPAIREIPKLAPVPSLALTNTSATVEAANLSTAAPFVKLPQYHCHSSASLVCKRPASHLGKIVEKHRAIFIEFWFT